MSRELIGLTSIDQSGFSTPSGTKRRLDIGHGLNALQENYKFEGLAKNCEAP